MSKLEDVPSTVADPKESVVTPVDSQTNLMSLSSYSIAMNCRDRDKLAAEVAAKCVHNPSLAPALHKQGMIFYISDMCDTLLNLFIMGSVGTVGLLGAH